MTGSEVVKEVPLYFKDKGEQLTVITVQPENHLVFVAIRDAAGKEIALNLGDDAVALVRMSAAATVSDTLQALCNPAKDSPGSTAANLPASMHARAPEAAPAPRT